KPRIVLRHAAHLRLLQHELGDEHAVRIARLAPRKVARGAGPPGEELARKRRPHPLSPSTQCGEGGRARRFFRAWVRLGGRRTAHGYPRYSPWATVRRSRWAPCGWSPAGASARRITSAAFRFSSSTCSSASRSGASWCPAPA